MLITFLSCDRIDKDERNRFVCTLCNCLRMDLSIDTENCAVDSEWKLLVFCVHTYALAQRTVRAVLCGDGTRIERNRSAETCKLLVYRWCESSLVPSVFHRSKSRFLSKMIKYGAHEMNRLNSIREWSSIFSIHPVSSARWIFTYIFIARYAVNIVFELPFMGFIESNNSINICARKFLCFSNEFIFFKILLSKPRSIRLNFV